MRYDYKNIGLKAGLEIHQQLNTKKLFCPCPSILRNDKPKYIIKRELNPVVGETGEVDVAAAFEKSLNKIFVYQVFDTNCLVELDEEPPHDINKDALKIALQIALLLNCKVFPVSQVMRKTVIDGSNTSGFQRTVMIGYNGWVDSSEGRVGIESIALEEDSARPVSSDKDRKVWKLDRLGIPLVEITTKPDLKTAEQIKEAALKIGEILRACNVKRGIGTIRQDLNISIRGTKRVEIKGFQEPKMMIKVIDNEIERQKKCIEEGSCREEVRGAKPDGSTEFQRPMPGAARMYPETDVPLLKISRKMLNEVRKNLPKLSSENRRYLKEFGLNDELVRLVLKEGKIEEFKILLNSCKDADLIAKSLTLFQKDIAHRKGKNLEDVNKLLNVHVLETVLEEVGHKISKGDVKNVLLKIVQGKSIEEAMKKADIELEGEIRKLIKENPGLSDKAYMGLIMGKFKGQVRGKEVSEVLGRVLVS